MAKPSSPTNPFSHATLDRLLEQAAEQIAVAKAAMPVSRNVE